jgi:membrane associated rhomboid family serine protease
MTYPVPPQPPGWPGPPRYPDCYRHPGIEMAVLCARCGRPICADCMVDASVGHQCPDCVRAGRRTAQVVSATSAQADYTATITLIVINIIAFTLTAVDDSILSRFAFWGGAVEAGEPHRVLTSMFLHAGLIHLGFNMYALYLFGRELEAVLGHWWFLVVYFVGGLAGNGLFAVLEPDGVAVGASGAVFGLFGAMFALALARRATPIGNAMFRQLGVLLGINLAIGFLVPGIAWQAHLGGLLAGFLMGWVFDRTPNLLARAGAVAVPLGFAVAAVAGAF